MDPFPIFHEYFYRCQKDPESLKLILLTIFNFTAGHSFYRDKLLRNSDIVDRLCDIHNKHGNELMKLILQCCVNISGHLEDQKIIENQGQNILRMMLNSIPILYTETELLRLTMDIIINLLCNRVLVLTALKNKIFWTCQQLLNDKKVGLDIKYFIGQFLKNIVLNLDGVDMEDDELDFDPKELFQLLSNFFKLPDPSAWCITVEIFYNFCIVFKKPKEIISLGLSEKTNFFENLFEKTYPPKYKKQLIQVFCHLGKKGKE
eukprot:UN24748